MPAATFQRHVEARLQRANARMENEIRQNNLPDAQAKELRAHFNTVAAQVEAVVQKVSADGTVTFDEAREVRAVARQLWGHRRHHQAEVIEGSLASASGRRLALSLGLGLELRELGSKRGQLVLAGEDARRERVATQSLPGCSPERAFMCSRNRSTSFSTTAMSAFACIPPASCSPRPRAGVPRPRWQPRGPLPARTSTRPPR